MLREILTNGFKDKNMQIVGKTNYSPDKSSKRKIKKPFSINQSNLVERKPIYNKAILNDKIDILKKRPDVLMNQINESTVPTTSNNKQFIYSNEITKNMKSPDNKKNINNNFKGFYTFGNSYKNSNGELNNNNIDKNNNINNNINDIDIIKENNENNNNIDIENDINDNIKINDLNNINNNNNKYDFSQKNNKNKSKTDSNQSLELNMTMLSPEGVDKIKLLEEYISQIKENSSNINEIKIQELQNQKDQLEYNVKYLSNNIRLIKKQFNDNIKSEKFLEAENEKFGAEQRKANKDAFILQKELPNNRVEIEIMKNKITQSNEEKKNINNYAYEVERQISEYHDEIKKINVKITSVIKEKDKIQNEINSINKKISIIKNKIYKAEKSANEFLFDVGQLAKIIQMNKKK